MLPLPGVLPALVVSEALRRPDGGGPGRFAVTDWGVSTEPLWTAVYVAACPYPGKM